MTDDESNLFRASMSDVIPLHGEKSACTVTTSVSSAQQYRFKQTQRRTLLADLTVDIQQVEAILPEAVIDYRCEGVQGSVFRLFKQGQYPMQATLDLRGLTVQHAREALVDYIDICIKQNFRNVLVIHGTGVHNKPIPALIKSFLAHWLQHIETVKAYHSAIKSLGGNGALMLMLAKSEQAKADTRELTRKGANIR
ncbi:DNA endonuclease SmrA [Shewanella sp. Isolate11]|uniref:DNA endonuclease SmrA n=1 Tax=Shewanella sp. Isolate11 TaxID=2908530 RepID=UPI001EFEEBDF|nr:DNA endonuclease SmrA [Shewanella sp. Isolate11]MCG9696595.1 DNA endonuclease SmrA [Shewanella sp. Isolate11]